MLPSWKPPFWGSCVSTLTSFPPIPLVVFISFAGSLDLKGQKCHKLVLDSLLFMNAICMPKMTKVIFSPDLFSGPHTHISIAKIFSFYCLTGTTWSSPLPPTSVNGTNHSLNRQPQVSGVTDCFLLRPSYNPSASSLPLMHTSNTSMLLTSSLLLILLSHLCSYLDYFNSFLMNLFPFLLSYNQFTIQQSGKIRSQQLFFA